jgi:endonuclease YncB( thermonuclease family)
MIRLLQIVTMMGALQGVALAEEIRGIPRIVDGDTIQIGTTKIRLQGIDAPETEELVRR